MFRTRKHTIAALFFSTYLLIQLGYPLFSLFTPLDRPAPRFAWQMYSRLHPAKRIFLVSQRGKVVEVDRRSLLGNPRLDLELKGPLVKALCEREPRAAAVRFVSGDKRREEIRCSR